MRILLFLLLPYQIVSYSHQVDSLINLGIMESYKFNFEAAEQLFNRAIENDPQNPEGYHYLSQIHLWFYLGSKDEAELIIFNRYSEIALTKAEKLAESLDNDPSLLNLQGEIYRFKTMASAAEGSAVDAFWHAKKAVSFYEDVLDIDSTYSGAYLGIGFFKYALSFVPGIFNIALTLSGLSGDKAEGLEDLIKSYQMSDESNIESAFLLSKIYTDYNAEYESADKLLQKLVKEYPDNYLFLYQYAILKLEQRSLDEAEKILNHIVSINSKKLSQTVALSHFLLAENSYKKKDYIEAIRRYDLFLEFTRSVDYTGLAYLNKALSHLMMNENLKAKSDLLFARNGNLEIPDDKYAKEISEQIFSSLPNSNELKIISAWNDIAAAKYTSALNSVSNIKLNLLRDDFKGLRQIILAECFIESGNFETAIKALDLAGNLEYEFNHWLKPYTYYLISKIHYLNNNRKAARDNVLIAEDLNIYNYKNKLEPRINYLKNRLFAE